MSSIEEKLNEFMHDAYRFYLTENADKKGYDIVYPDLPGCTSFGSSADEALKNGDAARKEWARAILETGKELPKPCEKEYSGQFRLRLPKSLHKRLAQRAQEEGTSLNQLCIHILSQLNSK